MILPFVLVKFLYQFFFYKVYAKVEEMISEFYYFYILSEKKMCHPDTILNIWQS